MTDERVTRRRVLQGAGVAGAAGLVALTPKVALASPGDHGSNSLVGAWQGTIAARGLPVFGSLTSFAAEGTLVASASVDLTQPFVSTPGYGAWRRTSPGNYAVKFRFFTFDAHDNPSGHGEVDATVAVSGDSQQGTFTLTIFDLQGNAVFSAPGTLTATRITV